MRPRPSSPLAGALVSKGSILASVSATPVARALAALAALVSTAAPAGRARAEAAPILWNQETRSPRSAAPDARLAPLLAACGAADSALGEVAARAARRQIEGAPLPTAEELAFDLRAAGAPQVWPRAWSISGQALDEEQVGARLRAWSAQRLTVGVRRCGVARAAAPDGTSVITAVTVDALADLAPLPASARVGQHVTIEGSMLVPASEARVLVLAPSGASRTVVTSLLDGHLRASFTVDEAGPWLVQVLATVASGARPVLDAVVFAGVSPPPRFVPRLLPGEGAAKGVKDDEEALLRMINGARASEQRSPLTRDPALDRLARDHTEAMRRARTVGHDIGGGDLAARLGAAGIHDRASGENCASAGSTEGAHRALWSSPSHRSNLLLATFTRVGVSVIKSADGTVWVTEIFGS
jgi:uncharacterized protein YkwD